MLGVIAALPAEARSLVNRRVRPGEPVKIADFGWLRLSGMGVRNALRATELLIGDGATSILSWGFAGALDPSLRAGMLVLPERVIGTNGDNYLVDQAWHRRLLQTLNPYMTVHTGNLLESREVVQNPESKKNLFHTSGAIAVDMESAGAAQAALAKKLPFAVIRSIVDEAGQTLPTSALNAIDDNGNMQIAQLLASLLRHPFELPALLALAKSSGNARESLDRIIKLAGQNLRSLI